MKSTKSLLVVLILLFTAACGQKDKTSQNTLTLKEPAKQQAILPVDKGFSEYISAYTSGIVPANAVVEIRFTPGFAAKTDKSSTSGLFTFDPAIKGKTEWKDDNTLVFTPSKILDPGKTIYRRG